MQGIEVGIDEILNCREKRVIIQNEIIKNGNLEDLKNLVPETTYNYFLSDEAKTVIDKIRSQDNVIHY